MNAQVKFHPDDDILSQFVRGELTTGNSVIVSAHMQMCKACSERVDELQSLAATSWVESTETDSPEAGSTETERPAADSKPYATLVADIVKNPQMKAEEENELVAVELEVLDESIRLPRVLAKAMAQGLKWQRLPGGVTEANLYLDDATRCEFIYIPPASKVPTHTHIGTEMTLILHGSFHDDMGEYRRADFTLRDPQHTHQPISDEGCLCFAVLDSPLRFTEGLAKLMNPYNRYKFRKGVFKPS